MFVRSRNLATRLAFSEPTPYFHEHRCMMWVYRHLIRPILFEQDSESIHERTLHMLARLSRNPILSDMLASFFESPELPVPRFGLHFPNPVGLAAGMDKFGVAVPAWEALGFGFSELGGVTWHAQPGNSPPRLFRAIQDEALVNRMGFNNAGAEAMAGALRDWRTRNRWPQHPVGINLGKSKITPLEEASADYAHSLRALWPYADFFVINVSSPNTPNLRKLQDKGALDDILRAAQSVNHDLAGQRRQTHPGTQEKGHAGEPTQAASPGPKPILIKVAPDLSFEALDEILELITPRNVAGIVATNTTIERPAASHPDLQRVYSEPGGLSGRPLRTRSTEIVRYIYNATKGTLPIVGVGGIFDAADAWEKITAGASLIQVYTGLVYEGPAIAKNIVQGLRELLAHHRLSTLEQAIGMRA